MKEKKEREDGADKEISNADKEIVKMRLKDLPWQWRSALSIGAVTIILNFGWPCLFLFLCRPGKCNIVCAQSITSAGFPCVSQHDHLGVFWPHSVSSGRFTSANSKMSNPVRCFQILFFYHACHRVFRLNY